MDVPKNSSPEVRDGRTPVVQKLTNTALDVPFMLLPFRPSSDPSAARAFVRNYFIPPNDRPKLQGEKLINELRMTEVMVRPQI